MSNLLIEIINAALCQRKLNEKNFKMVSENDWQHCYELALEQNVLAMTFPAMSSLPIELRPSRPIWLKWMAYAHNVAVQSRYQWHVVKKISSWLSNEQLSTTILKGFSLSTLYPYSELREFNDIDIFSGEDYGSVNACFAKHGVPVKRVDGHHAYLKIDGVPVEHHFAFHNTKVKNGLNGSEEVLQRLVVSNPHPTSIPGINFPCASFTALFVGWHAFEHFLQEKIELSHLIDWALALRALTPSQSLEIRQSIEGEKWSLFADTMTSLGINKLGLPQEWFTQPMAKSTENVDSSLSQSVWDDIINTPRTQKSKSSNRRRLYIAKRMLRNNWKYKEFANISASRYLLNEFAGHLKSLNN